MSTRHEAGRPAVDAPSGPRYSRRDQAGPEFCHAARSCPVGVRSLHVVLHQRSRHVHAPAVTQLAMWAWFPTAVHRAEHVAGTSVLLPREPPHTMSSPKPNLFVIGAAKSGTTSLHHYLARHPDVYMSDPKEPGYFAEGMDYYPTDEKWYLALFEKGTGARYRGESSTHYTKLPVYPGVAERIAGYCGSPWFIYLMRDPIDRAISQYWHHIRQNTEFRPPLRAIRENVEYKAYGDYVRQLEPYLEIFGADRVFATTFERLVEDPQSVTSRIFRWLDLDPDRAPSDFPAKNTAPESIDRFMLGQAAGEFLYQSKVWDALSPLVPQPLKDAAKRTTTRSFTPTDYPMDQVKEKLRPWAQEVAARTANLLGREPSEWTTTLNPG